MSHIPVAVISSCFSFAELNRNSYLKFPVYLVAASDLCHLPNISLRIDDRFLSLCSSASCGNWMWGLWVLPRDECCEESLRKQGVEAVSCWLPQLLLISVTYSLHMLCSCSLQDWLSSLCSMPVWIHLHLLKALNCEIHVLPLECWISFSLILNQLRKNAVIRAHHWQHSLNKSWPTKFNSTPSLSLSLSLCQTEQTFVSSI